MQLFICLSLLLLSLTFLTNGTEFREMKRIKLTNGVVFNLYVDYCKFVAFNESSSENTTLADLTLRCYCYYDDSDYVCGSPGPTLVFYNGSNFTVNLVNRMVGSSIGDDMDTFFHDPDVTNLHTHGLHVDPNVDDVINIFINPQTNHSYNYKILPSHYPGTHWYHAHWHGSVTFQVQSGMIGAILVEREHNEGIDENLANMVEKVVMFHGMFLRSKTVCDTLCNEIVTDSLVYDQKCNHTFTTGDFLFQGLCDVWCCMNQAQRDASSGKYDNSGPDYTFLHLVNGLIEPTLTLNSSEYIRLRLINGQAQLDYNIKFPNECEQWLISLDGIFFENGGRDLSAEPFLNYLFLPSAGRADVIIKCPFGSYAIKNDVNHPLNQTILQYPVLNITTTLLYLNVLSTSEPNSLPLTFPTYPDYLTNTLSRTDYNPNCPCVYNESYGCSFNPDPSPDGTESVFGVNHLPFNAETPLMYVNNKNKLFHFTIGFFPHPFHHHINPFQLLQNDSFEGYFAQAGNWRDTLAVFQSIPVNTWLLDYTGNIVIHCHFLPHEDHGLMGFYVIQNSDDCPFDEANNSIKLFSWYTIFIHFIAVAMYLEFYF